MAGEILLLPSGLRQTLPHGREFDALMTMQGEVFREHKNRRTIRATIGEYRFFIKSHRPASWLEIVKNALRLRWPVLTASTEWEAIARLTILGVPTTPAEGWGVRGRWPNRLESFLVTRALEDMVLLSDLLSMIANLPARTRARLKHAVIAELAGIARQLHGAGLNHRDFYLCHFMLPQRDWSVFSRGEAIGLHVIDLHRVQARAPGTVPRRWIVKDIAGLLFSSLDAGLATVDCVRFLRGYWGEEWRMRWKTHAAWRRAVMNRAVRLYRSEHGRPPRLPAGLASFA